MDLFGTVKDLQRRVKMLESREVLAPTQFARQSGGGGGGIVQCIVRAVNTTTGIVSIQRIVGDGLVATVTGPVLEAKPRVGEYISAFDDPAYIRAVADPETFDNSAAATAFFPFVAFSDAGTWRVMFPLNTDSVMDVMDETTVQTETYQG